MSVSDAYRECEEITRGTAANFYYGIRLLPPARRRAMCAVYAFARRVDDIGDGPLGAEEKLRLLDGQAQALARLAAGGALAGAHGAADGGRSADGGGDPVMVALGDAYPRFAVPPDALEALIAGVRMDVEGVAYETFDELVLYCRRVAGAIGRACLAIFALRSPEQATRARAPALADDLGVALQLTNILRDVREDAHNGRVYLPAEDLRRFGLLTAGEERRAAIVIGELTGAGGGDREIAAVSALVRFEADRARTWFDRGLTLAPLLDRRSAACVLAMANIYSGLLDRIEADPSAVLNRRIALGTGQKALIAAYSMLSALRGAGR